jgi:hypothetical protein
MGWYNDDLLQYHALLAEAHRSTTRYWHHLAQRENCDAVSLFESCITTWQKLMLVASKATSTALDHGEARRPLCIMPLDGIEEQRQEALAREFTGTGSLGPVYAHVMGALSEAEPAHNGSDTVLLYLSELVHQCFDRWDALPDLMVKPSQLRGVSLDVKGCCLILILRGFAWWSPLCLQPRAESNITGKFLSDEMPVYLI